MAYTKNMTEGKPFPLIFAYFVPVLCSTLCQQLYSIIDTIVVGKGIDDMALAAVGSTGGITFFIFGFIMGLGWRRHMVREIMNGCVRRSQWEWYPVESWD